MKVQFNDAVSRVQGLDSFFYLLNQYTGVTTSIPATCIKVANDFTVEFNVIDCFGDVLDAKTVYVFFISQRMRDGELQTLSSVKGVPVSEKASLSRPRACPLRPLSVARRQAASHLAIRADVVPEKCIPSFNQVMWR